MQLISASEAVRFFDYATYSDLCAARDVAIAFQRRPKGYDPDNDSLFLLACVFHAGCIQGIREKRQRNKLRSARQNLPGCKPIGVARMPDGRTIPLLQMGGFINTCEGWNLYVKCSNAAHDAMEPYNEAKAAWEAEQQNHQ